MGVWGALGILVVLLLSQMSSLDRDLKQRRQPIAVFQWSAAHGLTDDRLVDALSAIPLRNRPIKVSWDHAILAVDLRADSPADVGYDMSRLILYAYQDAPNVKQVLIRVIGENEAGRALLLAVETRKLDWTKRELDELHQPLMSDLLRLPSKLRLSVTAAGERWLGNFANS
ncbi:hypothetical protein ACFO1S_04915 [Cohnella boryungensis]|uniref:Uncharacterized protein n=1 Tax=Cohnella boryungensis TaxID=768479 RepID=A0ABV8S791_9BACL